MKLRARISPGLQTLALLASTLLWTDAGSAAPAFVSGIVSSDKGGFQYSQPPAFPELKLDLAPIERQVAAEAKQYCGTAMAAAPLDLGDAESFMSKAMGKAAGAAIGQLVGGLFGGGGSKEKPDLYKDPIRNKYKQKIEHPSGDARIRIGGQSYEDGLLMSAKVDKAAGQGTFHTMFLEMPDCTRIWPEQYLGYDLWGSWSLSVSVTKTSSSYRNGELVDRSVTQSAWSKSGDFDFSRGFSLWDQIPGGAQHMILQGDQAYLSQLRREIDVPAWQAMGFGEPTEGIRSAGGLFRVAPEDLAPGTIAVVHITHVDKGRYRTVGFPLRFEFVDDGRMAFTQMTDAQE